MNRLVIATICDHSHSKTSEQALIEVSNKYKGIKWKYRCYSSHNSSYVFDGITNINNIPDELESFELKDEKNSRLSIAILNNESCLSCCSYNHKKSTCQNISLHQNYGDHIYPRHEIQVNSDFFCSHWKEIF